MATSCVFFPVLIPTAAAIPAPCPLHKIQIQGFSKYVHFLKNKIPVTVHAIMFLIAACEVLSPATHRPATKRFLTFGGNMHP